MQSEKKSLIGIPFNAVGLVAYQEGAVVSRTIHDKKVGSITLFAFDAGQGLSEHTSPYAAFVSILEGAADISVDGKHVDVTAGECIIMPANKPHALRAQTRFKMMLVMIRET